MSEKKRLDALLVERGFFSGRAQAKAAVMAGEVRLSGRVEDKAGTLVPADAEIEVSGKKCPYVSRGGLKLAKALEVFSLSPQGQTVLDIGSSTGGFVDCLLQNGAEKVYAVDVGYGQLDWRLRQDARVVVMEKTNARYLSEREISEAPDMITADVSFISLAKVLPAPLRLLREEGLLLALVKPQFEAGRAKVGKGGLVRDRSVHPEVVSQVFQFLLTQGMAVLGLTFSPLTGADGNIEYLVAARKTSLPAPLPDIEAVVEEAWRVYG
ncbi:MAG: TlyA family RNA methyltransferase [Clostridiales bacterium]|nr:TlyA family RNA methyltransferase [Clostridiales bacterium]